MIESPRLDNRSFQDIVNEAKRLIPVHCPEWTDHNLSDPGVTLIELFAWMTDSIIYRINQVPERASAQLLKLIGVTPAPPRPATADLTFFLSAPAETPFVVPAGTEAATENTDQSDAIVFTTLGALTMPASAKPVRCESRTGDQVTDCSKLLRRPLRGDEPPVEIFQRIPAAGDALVLSFERDLSGLVLNLKLRCDSKRGTGIDPRNPPLKWEYLVEGKQEVTCYVYDDTTRGLNEAGDIRLMIPLQPRTENDTPANSQLRCVLQAPSGPATPRYDSSPAMRSITVEVIGGTTV